MIKIIVLEYKDLNTGDLEICINKTIERFESKGKHVVDVSFVGYHDKYCDIVKCFFKYDKLPIKTNPPFKQQAKKSSKKGVESDSKSQ